MSLNKINTILKIYETFDTEWLPQIQRYELEAANPFIEFCWVAGKPIAANQLPLAFYELGKFHRKNFIEDENIGFSTLCHGDFHAKNIIEAQNGIMFVDVEYLYIENNFSDVDYLDLFDWFNPTTHPWMIKDSQCFIKYLEGCEIIADQQKQEKLKREIMERTLNKFIANAQKNQLDASLEKQLLKRLNRQNTP